MGRGNTACTQTETYLLACGLWTTWLYGDAGDDKLTCGVGYMAQPIELYSSHSSLAGCAIKQTTDMLSSWLIESCRLRNRDLRDSEIAMYY